jgi:hypothetical protein
MQIPLQALMELRGLPQKWNGCMDLSDTASRKNKNTYESTFGAKTCSVQLNAPLLKNSRTSLSIIKRPAMPPISKLTPSNLTPTTLENLSYAPRRYTHT